jgi:hypothetical protein
VHTDSRDLLNTRGMPECLPFWMLHGDGRTNIVQVAEHSWEKNDKRGLSDRSKHEQGDSRDLVNIRVIKWP